MAFANKKRWELDDLRTACTTFFNPKINEEDKARTFRNLGRTFSAVHTISYQMRAIAEGRSQEWNGYTRDQARYALGLQDTPFPPRPEPPAAPEPAVVGGETDPAVVGDATDPETLQRVMALVKFELGKQSSELLLEQAATLDGIHGILKDIAAQLAAQTQILQDLATPAYVQPNGRVDLPANGAGFRRHRS